MPLFEIKNDSLQAVNQSNYKLEKQLQKIIEKNLLAAFNSRFVATEFSTGARHAGRIDTLALSEDNNPVIIEYKKVESSELVLQSLYYLNWLHDHQGDFELAATKTLGKVEIDWSDIRVICLAPNYKKFDLHAVQVIGANIELWRYRLFANSCLYLEEVFRKDSDTTSEVDSSNKNPVMIAAGKKAALTRANSTYTFDQHIANKPENIRNLALSIQEFISGMDTAIEESPKKLYVAYKSSQNIACMEVQQQKIYLFLKLNPKTTPGLPPKARDMTDKGHFGTGDLELTIQNEDDLELAKPFIQMAYQQVGG